MQGSNLLTTTVGVLNTGESSSEEARTESSKRSIWVSGARACVLATHALRSTQPLLYSVKFTNDFEMVSYMLQPKTPKLKTPNLEV